MRVTVIDSECGTGKTEYAISKMNNNIESNFMYITPYLEEIKRVINSVNTDIVTPNDSKFGKMPDLFEVMQQQKSIASTHSLFSRSNERVKNLISNGRYHLILDEAMTVIEPIKISKKDINMLIDNKYIDFDEYGVVNVLKGGNKYINDNCKSNGIFDTILMLAKEKRLILHNNMMLLWEFPYDIFKQFESVTILTYMFTGQTMYNYLRANGVEFDFYHLKDYKLVEGIADSGGSKYKNLIDIYKGRLNNIGHSYNALSKSWFESKNNRQASIDNCKTLVNNTYNYTRNIVKSKSSDTIWTTFKSFKDRLSGRGYASAFISSNMRATNNYSDRHICLYLLNKYENPILQKYFKLKDIDIDEDMYALSEMVQWIFRSAIRQNEKIKLYIPSRRMRELLEGWLEGNIGGNND